MLLRSHVRSAFVLIQKYVGCPKRCQLQFHTSVHMRSGTLNSFLDYAADGRITGLTPPKCPRAKHSASASCSVMGVFEASYLRCVDCNLGLQSLVPTAPGCDASDEEILSDWYIGGKKFKTKTPTKQRLCLSLKASPRRNNRSRESPSSRPEQQHQTLMC